MKHLPLFAASVGFLLFGVGEIAAAQAQPQVIDDSQMKALSTTIGGANPLPAFMGDLNPFPGFRLPATGCQ